MNNLKIPVGISDFTKIRENGYYYIDKTELICSLLEPEPAEVTLITRPRRFGKTLGMSMLASFLDIRKDSGSLFEGLEILEHEELCEKWMNQYPVLFLSFKDVDGTSFENALNFLGFTIAQFCIEQSYLAESEKVNSDYKAVFARLKSRAASLTDIKGSILTIMKMMAGLL